MFKVLHILYITETLKQ